MAAFSISSVANRARAVYIPALKPAGPPPIIIIYDFCRGSLINLPPQSQSRVDVFLQFTPRFTGEPYNAGCRLASFKENQRGYTHYTILPGGLCAIIDIHFYEGDLAIVFFGKFFNKRRNHTARPAPWRPEID